MDTANDNFTAKVKDFLRKTSSKFKLNKLRPDNYRPEINENGLISEYPEKDSADQPGNEAVLAKQDNIKNEQLEKLQSGFNQLIGQLNTINTNLSQQVDHQQKLIERLDKLPQIVEGFTPTLENQKHLVDQLMNDLKSSAKKNQQFIDAVELIPTETAKQTDALSSIDHQLAAAADSDVQMSQSFRQFRASIDKLDQSTASQTDGIMQMSKTFAASDRYLKFIISRDKKRMFWLFIASLSVCLAVILTLTGIIIYVAR